MNHCNSFSWDHLIRLMARYPLINVSKFCLGDGVIKTYQVFSPTCLTVISYELQV